MTKTIKGHTGWHQATPKISHFAVHSINLATRIIAAIAILILLGWVPASLVDCDHEWGGFSDET